MRTAVVFAIASGLLLLGSPGFAKFTTEPGEEQIYLGNSDKLANGKGGEGTRTEETEVSGPPGQIKQDDKCHNCTPSEPEVTDPPGNQPE